MQTPNGTSRIAACWYSATGFDIDVNLTDGQTHRIAVYFCDWDNAGRSQQSDLIDAQSGTIMNSNPLSSFGGGNYLVWDVKGHVKIRVTKGTGPHAVASGVFLQPAGASL